MGSGGDSSFLMWLMAAVVSLLAAYLFIGWVRRGQAAERAVAALPQALLGGSMLGLGISAAMLLALSAEALPFPLGYRWIFVPALLVGGVLACIPVAWLLTRSQRWFVLLAAALLLAGVALAVQLGWLWAAGLRPGLRWNLPLLGASAAVGWVGFVAALWLAYSDASSDGGRKTLWRVAAAALVMLTLLTGQEVAITAVSLQLQVGSVYQREASATWMVLAGGAVLPTVMAVLALDLVLRNKGDRTRRAEGLQGLPLKRRKRRRKYRML